MDYRANEHRYDAMLYRRTGNSGLKLPAVSLGIWHNFGGAASYEDCRDILCGAFDHGITHFDAANNYGPPPGSAEETLGRALKDALHSHRDELIISTKAGYHMWPGPYGDWGSKKYLLSSLDQSLKRLQLEYVDIFYHHRPDPETPLEESMEALAHAVRFGKALYVGISNYSAEQTRKAYDMLQSMGVRLLVSQPRYSMLAREFEHGPQQALLEKGVGAIAFSPLAKGVLTSRYFEGIPADSRAGGPSVFLTPEAATAQVDLSKRLDAIARERGQTLAQMALAWVLNNPAITSVCVGASRLSQLLENLGALNNLSFTDEELLRIETILPDTPTAR